MGRLKKIFDKINNSLKIQLIGHIVVLIIVFVVGFQIYSFVSIRNYNYNNLKSLLLGQAKLNSELYLSYVSDYTVNDNINNERFNFINNSKGQVQILDKNNVVIYDNLASTNIGTQLNYDDVASAKEGRVDSLIYFNGKEKVMSLSYPILKNGANVGIIRITSALYYIDQDVMYKFSFFLVFGVFAVIFGIISSIFIASRVFKPINNLTILANKLSDGQYNEKSGMSYLGEIGELAKVIDELSENIVYKEEIKTEFISSVSHELRTPLTSIKGWSITLQDDSVDRETTVEGLKIIEKEADRLTDMVEDLLDFSRFKSPKFSLNKVKFNLIDTVKNITKQLNPRMDEKGISMVLNFNDPITEIIADENRIKQVFINLLDNAIKFTHNKGTIIINIEDNYHLNEVMVEVVDTGIGISEEEIDLVTTKFYKGTSSESHTGLGLSICEEIIVRHNGKLEIESKLDVGTKIIFKLPKGDLI